MLKDHTVNIESRRYHHGDLRAALLNAGLALLAVRKADDLSLREVARSVGVSANAVYRHFPDKAALMRALATEGLKALALAQHGAAEAAGGGTAGFEATGRAYVRFALANPALFRLIFSNPMHVDLLSEPTGDVPDAMTFLRANAEIAAGTTGDAKVIALRAWSQAHGLAMLLLDAQVAPEDAIIDAVFAPDNSHSVRN
jgi:AcrR family transcriptional regulator